MSARNPDARAASPAPGGVPDSAPREPARHHSSRATIAPAIGLACSLLALAVHGAMSVAMWRYHVVPSWDLGIFSQLAQAYSRLDIPIVDIKANGFNLLGDHFHPLLILLGPLWRLAPSGLTLLLTQTVLFALAVYPLTRLAAGRLGPGVGAACGVSFALSWGLIEASWSQFHEIAFAVPLLAWGLTWWLEGKTLRAALLLALLPFVKEDLGLTLMALAVALFLRAGPARRERRLQVLSGAMAGWGALWFILAIKVILPALNPHGTWDYTDNLSLAEQLTQGWEAKSFSLVLLLLACGIIGLRSPIMLAVVPTLAWRFLGNVEYYWGPTMHYSAVLIPICLAALIDAATRINPAPDLVPDPASDRPDPAPNRQEPATNQPEPVPNQLEPAGNLLGDRADGDGDGEGLAGDHAGENGADEKPADQKLAGEEKAGKEKPGGTRGPRSGRALVRVAAGAVLAGSLVMLPAGHASIMVTAPSYDFRPEGIIAAAAQHEAVSADVTLLAYLVPHTRVFWYGTTRPGDVDAVAIKAETADGDAAGWAGARWGGQWRIEFDDGTWQLAVRYR